MLLLLTHMLFFMQPSDINEVNLQLAVENIVNTKSKMHDFYKLLRSLKYTEDPGHMSSPLACDLRLKCHRVFAKFASIQDKLDVFKYEMVLSDKHYNEEISKLEEVKKKILIKIEEINSDFEEIRRKSTAPAPTKSSPTGDKRKSHTHGLPMSKVAPSGQKTLQRFFGLNKGLVNKSPATATASKSPMAGVTTAAIINTPTVPVNATNQSPAYCSVFTRKSPSCNSATESKPYEPLSTTLYQVSSQLGQHITEYNRNR